MEILRFKCWNDHDPDAMAEDPSGEYVSYATHRALFEKMEQRALAAELKLAVIQKQDLDLRSIAGLVELVPPSIIDQLHAWKNACVAMEIHKPGTNAQSHKKIEIHGDATWADFEAISDLPEVFEAMQNFSEDPTGDNGICVIRAILEATERQTDYEYLRDEGIEYLINALGVDPDDDVAEPYLLVTFLKEFTDKFITPNGVKWVDYQWDGKDETLPGYRITLNFGAEGAIFMSNKAK